MRRYTLNISDREFVVDVQEIDADNFEVVVGDDVGIAVPVPHAVGDVVRIVIPYSQTEGFRTDDPAWNSFQ